MPNAQFVPVAPLNTARTAQARHPYLGQRQDASDVVIGVSFYFPFVAS
jgi:hypothetical protein